MVENTSFLRKKSLNCYKYEEKNMTKKYYLLIYTVVADYLEKRADHRSSHLNLVTDYMNKGSLLLGGAVDNPADKAYFCFHCQDANEVEEFVKKDPYFQNNIIASYEIRNWNVVTGTACKKPLLPSQLS